MEETQRRVKNAVDGLIDELDKSYLRDIQKRMFNCSAQCCDDKRSSRQGIEECVEKCNLPMKRAQTSLENELGTLQDQLSRCTMTCYDKLVQQMGLDPDKYTETQLVTFKNKLRSNAQILKMNLRSCLRTCVFVLLFVVNQAICGRGITLPIVDDRTQNPQPGRICAYGDINKDRYTDLVVQRGPKLFILLQSEGGSFKDSHRYTPIELNVNREVFCTVGDFNGDAVPDILVVAKGRETYSASIYYVHESTHVEISLNQSYIDQPVVMDVNGDGISDILGFVYNNTRPAMSCITGSRSNAYEDCAYRFVDGDFSAGVYSYFPHIFMDLDGDLCSEIVFGLNNGKVGLDFLWRQTKTLIPPLPDDPEIRHFGAPLVGDFNSDQNSDILLPVCREASCTRVDKFLAWSLHWTRWEWFHLDMKEAELIVEPNSIVAFRVGEFSLDGYPDLIATVKMNGMTGPMILENVASDNGNFTRRFEINLQKDFRIIMPAEMAKSTIVLSSFFDLKEDGNLDILVEYKKDETSTFVDFIKCDDKGDTTFLKVQVFSNVCADDCPATPISDRGSGISWVGACSSYSMSTSFGKPRVSTQCQLPQTSYRTFHSPFILFGLGRSPNFVDIVQLGSPRWPVESLNQRHSLKQLVPNSRVIIVPPERDGTHWQSRLYLTPSRLIIQSLLVQISVCFILFCLVLGLHLREKKADRKERQSQSHRFHFDAIFKDIPIDQIYVSPFTRTMETASKLLDGNHPNSINVEPGLCEGFFSTQKLKEDFPRVNMEYSPICPSPLPKEGMGDEACIPRLRKTINGILDHNPDSPKEDDTISRHVDAAKNLNCTHVVYGYALIDQHQNLHDPNVNDFPMAATLQKQQQPTKLLLAIREKERINFIDSSHTRAKVINNIIQKAVFHYFDGIFLDLRSTSLLSFHYENFVRELRTELNVRATATSQKPLQLVVAVNAQNVFEAHRKLGTFAHMVDQLYLKSDEVISAVDENTAVLVEPLYGDTETQLLDTISETAESIVSAGVPAEQVVIGLSSWARGYNLASNSAVNGAPVSDFVRMDDSMRSDGRFAFQEICELANSTELIHHDKSCAVSFVLNETQFFSYNPPRHKSVARKIRWISSHGYGGIGIMQLEADDPTNHCGLGEYPLATAIAKQFKCSKRQHDQEKTTSCNRVCIYRPNVNHISYESLMPNWCSHIVVSSIEFKDDGSISETKEFKSAITEYAKWSVIRKPFLILSIGAEMNWNQWDSLITNSSARHVFVQNARQIYVDSNAHGLELSLLDPIEVSAEITQKVQTDFSNLLEELRKEMPKSALIFVTVTPFLTFANAYSVDMLNRNTDFIILEGHRFHPSPTFTGHHSPLFSDGKLLANSNMSIESMANVWTSYPKDRILIGFSSLGTRISLPVGAAHQEQRSDGDTFLGLPTDMSQTDRSSGSGLCEELVGSSTIHQYIAELGIPVAKKNDEFFAYDDVRSIQTKTIWSSMNGFGGVAFHAIEGDNAEGKCPSGQPFSLLRKMADTQTCQQCVQLKFEEQGKCDPDPFSVICSYRLPDEKDQQPMWPAAIPFENCSEVVVEDLLWSADGHLRFRDQKSRDQLIALTELRETNQLAKQTRLIAAIKCGMLPEKMEEMLSSDRNLTASILEHLHRIPVSNNNLTEKYDIQLLNSHSTVSNWVDSGVQAKKIIVHIPSYGIVQNFSTTVKAFGAGVQSNYTMIAQRDICTLLQRPNVHQHTFYDMIAAYATTPENQWITYETPSILEYKVNYAIREHLGGVGLVPLNRDDFQNNCGNGAFPLLNTIKQSICTV
ncbi:Protein of unknown function DUF842 domain containing protein [Aphelenchoides besseyi]|nr:Protein of unknown function DUF842 domain containing protein [Aphelenchoides besseyi]